MPPPTLPASYPAPSARSFRWRAARGPHAGRSRARRAVLVVLLAVLLAVLCAVLTITTGIGAAADGSASPGTPLPVASSSATAVTSATPVSSATTVTAVAAETAAPESAPDGRAAGGAPVVLPRQDSEGSSCSPFDIGGCVSAALGELLGSVVESLLNPALEWLGDTLLTTPTPDQLPRVTELWGMSWQIVLAVYSSVILVGGLVVMAHQTVQTQHGAREILPRLVAGFVAGGVSLPLCGMAIELANAVSRAILADGVDPISGTGGLRELLTATVLGGEPGLLGFAMLALAVLVVLIALLCGYVLRVAVVVCLIAVAPLALMWHALPQTDGVARWWWRAMAGCLVIQILQSLALVIGLRVLLAPGQFSGVFGGPVPTTSGLTSLLVLLVLLWIIWKIPGWVWTQWIGGSRGGGRSLLGSIVGAAVAFQTGGLLNAGIAAVTGRRGVHGGRPGRPGSASQAAGSEATDPNEQVPVGGQLALFAAPARRRRRRPSPATGRPRTPAATGRKARAGRRPRAEQLALPLEEGFWPEQQPVLGPDGQYRLRIDAQKVPPRKAGPSGGSARGAGRRSDAEQLAFPLDEGWPEQQPVLGPDGQYRLRIDAQQIPRNRLAYRFVPRRPWQRSEAADLGRVPPNYVGGGFAEPPPRPPFARQPGAGQMGLPFDETHGPGPADDAQAALPFSVRRIAAQQVHRRFVPTPQPATWRVPPGYVGGGFAEPPPRQPDPHDREPRDGQLRMRGVPAGRVRRDRLAYRFVPPVGRPEPADLGAVPPDYVAHPQPPSADPGNGPRSPRNPSPPVRRPRPQE